MDLLQYTDKSKTINERIQMILNAIESDYNNGVIKTETEYVYRVKSALESFYKSLSQPLFTYRPARNIPISDDYNTMITEAYQDLTYLINDCKSMGKNISQSYTDAELGRTMLKNELAYQSKLIKQIGESIASNKPDGTVVFTEIFETTDNTGNIRSQNACTVDTTIGILTLRHTVSGSTQIKDIEIDNSVSNGFPGNTHVVDTLNTELHYSGEDNLHFDISKIINGNRDQWFEFELFHITDDTRRECNSYGFEYDEGVMWINENEEPLRLKLVLNLESEEICSWFTLTPHLSEVKGANPCVIEKLELVTASNSSYVLTENKAFSDSLVFPFQPQAVKKVVITLVQPSSYPVTIGHTYYNAVETQSMSIFDDSIKNDKNSRVHGHMPSVNLLGVKYDPATKWIEYPTSETNLPDKTYVKQELFKTPTSTIDKKAGSEIINAERFMIGIERAKVSHLQFMEYSEYVSVGYATKEPITAIVLKSEEYIPGDNPEALKYFVSVDNGVNWHKIYPTHRAYDGIYRYTVNNDSIENLLTKDTSKKRSKNLTTLQDVYSVKLKIEMTTPEGIENVKCISPVVYSYQLILETGGENIEY